MTDTHSWEVVSIDIDTESDHTNCRCIERIGFLAPTLNWRTVKQAVVMMESGLSGYHITKDGARMPLRIAGSEQRYLRVTDSDSETDPLLDLPEKQVFEQKSRFESV